jgi:hypothetical protein
MADHKLLHDATVTKVNVLIAQHFSAESWHHVTYDINIYIYIYIYIYFFLDSGFNLNQTNDSEVVTDYSTAK